MNSYLVLGRCAIDDIPMYLSEDRDKAYSEANKLKPVDVCNVAGDILNLDTSIVHAVAVVEFYDGFPVGFEIVQTFDDDDQTDDEGTPSFATA